MMKTIKRTFMTLIMAMCMLIVIKGNIFVSASQTPVEITSSDLIEVGEIDVTTLNSMLGGSGYYLQNFSRYGSTSIYFITTYDSSGTTYLIRCQLSSGYIVPQDYVALSGFGHGESLEVMAYDSSTSTYTIWLGTTVNTSGWSTEIARIKYQVTSTEITGAKVNSGTTKTITGLVNAALGSTGNTDYRSAVSITSVSDDRICFSTKKAKDNVSGWYYMVYDYSDVNDALDNTNASSISLSSLSSYRKSIFWISVTEGNPNNSFQGEEITGVGSGNKMLFLAGGSVGDDCGINQFSYTNGNNVALQCQYIVKNTTAPSNHFIKNAEIEGIKIYTESSNDYMYMMFRKAGSSFRFKIYKYQI